MINIYGTLKQFSKRDITREDKEYLEFLIRALIIENYPTRRKTSPFRGRI
jgi:hypothetical protein